MFQFIHVPFFFFVPFLLSSWFWYYFPFSWNSRNFMYWKSMKVKVAQSCLTLCSPMDYTLHGIPQVTILEWVAFSFSRGSSQPRDRTQVSCIAGGFFINWATREAHWTCISSVQFSRVRLFATPWITARQASLSITNSRSSLKLMSIE